jgi:nitroimidazol reductase NimA-like FMN-containing flavoprotein (pyridoxamine 5'-phosphate oxidase superfamily)
VTETVPRAVTRRVETLTRDACAELLASVPVGRVVFTDGGLPGVLPVAFVVDGASIVLRTAEGSRLAKAADDAVLAFEVDQLVTATRTGWSVVVTGHARRIDDPIEQQRLDDVLESWVPGIKDVFIRIPFTVLTGRRVLEV